MQRFKAGIGVRVRRRWVKEISTILRYKKEKKKEGGIKIVCGREKDK